MWSSRKFSHAQRNCDQRVLQVFMFLQPGLQNLKYKDLLLLEEVFPKRKAKLLFSTNTKPPPVKSWYFP